MRSDLRGGFRPHLVEIGTGAVKVLDVTEFYSERGGGVRSHLALKGHVLCQLGHEHLVVAPGPQDTEEEVEVRPGFVRGRLARADGRARVIRLKGPASPYDPTYQLLVRFEKIREIVRRERPDVLEIHSPYAAAMGALLAPRDAFGVRTFQWHSDFIDTYGGVLQERLAAGIARVADRAFPGLTDGQTDRSLPGLDGDVVPGQLNARARIARGLSVGISAATFPLWGLVRSIARRCDATLVASTCQVEKLTRNGVLRVTHVPFGIERDIFHPTARTQDGREELLARAGREPSSAAAILVGVGRFAIEKRWDLVIDAFARVRGTRDAILVLFGDGPERSRLEARAAGSRDIVFAGFLKDRPALARALASADLFVHGCPFETFGLSIAEAMSAGLPAVIPDKGGAAEMHVDGASECYRAGDVDDLTRAIRAMLLRLDASGSAMHAAAAAATAARPNVTEQFEHQIELYRRLLRSPRAAD